MNISNILKELDIRNASLPKHRIECSFDVSMPVFMPEKAYRHYCDIKKLNMQPF